MAWARTAYTYLLGVFIAFQLPAGLLHAQALDPPSWARGAIWYLVVPDRFANGDTANDPVARDICLDPSQPWTVSPWTGNWYKRSVEEIMVHEAFYPAALLRHYGGDLQGMLQRLDYLDSLNITGVILTPVFEARSSHKYDAASFHHVDRHFGPRMDVDTTFLNRENPVDPKTWYFTSADRLFLDVINALHRRGIRVLLSAQFAHCGADFWAFQDVLKQQEKSIYANWFTVKSWDKPETPYSSEFDFDKMWGIDAFPRFRQDTLGLVPGPKDYVYAATRRWMDPNGDGNPADGIDGWCVDLTEELPQAFWEQWAAYCRTLNPDVLLVNMGESKGRAATPFDVDRPHAFGRAVTSFMLAESISSTTLDAQLMELRSRTTLSGSDVLLNLVGSHETDRIASMCQNLGLPYDQRNSPRENPAYRITPPDDSARALQRMIILLQNALPGSPVLYFGDEAGMWGGDDPDNRKPMPWPEFPMEAESTFEVNGDDRAWPVTFDSSMYRYYRTVHALRKDLLPLRTGTMQTLLLDDVASLYAFVRASGSEKVYVAVNAGDRPQVCTLSYLGLPDGVRLEDPLLGVSFFVRRDAVSITLPGRTATLLVPRY